MTEVDEEFDRATAHRILDGDIERAQLLCGLDLAVDTREYVTTASHDAIRNFAHGLGDDNPLYCDEDYGRSTRWDSQIAPSTMAGVINAPLRGDPIDPDIKAQTRGLFRGIHVFVSGGTWQWFRPIRPGDRLYSFGGIQTVTARESEFAERSVIRTRRYVKINQRAEVVAVQQILAILTERRTARHKGKYADIEPATYAADEISAIDAVYAAEGPRGAEPRWWEDVEVGDELGRMAKGPLTVTEIIVFHAGGYGFTPYAPSASRLGFKNRRRIPGFYVNNEYGVPDVAQRVHWDSAWARAIGNPMAYDYGVMRECWLHHFLTDWMGDDGWVAEQHDEIRRFNYIGDTQFITGEVVGKDRDDEGRCWVEIELRATNQRDEVTVPATATVLLPSREHGPVVLPDPPAELEQRASDMLRRHDELAPGFEG